MKVRSLGSESCYGRVSISLTLSLVLASLLCVVLFAESVEGKVLCYVCSWHSPSPAYGENMTDTCSHYNFDEAYTRTVECDRGCEAVSIRKSRNDNVTNFYKNCMSEESLQSKDQCTSSEDKQYRYVTTCECTSNLCNQATRRHNKISVGCLLIATLIARY